MNVLPPGTVVDRYVLESLLGEGGMSVVYRARHRDLGSLHAIKQLRVKDPDIRERLVQEGRMQSGLRHPNIVSVTDMVTLDGSPALVMEYVAGPSLADLLARHRPSIEQCDAIARGVLKGVAAAHGHGLVHRDLKPANILIAVTDDEVVPKIADFGLAKLLEGETNPHGMTQEGTAMGTPGYMAPEQINDSSKVDRRADVFSLGAILYELVTGRHCFEGEGVMAVWQAIGKGDFIPPKSQSPALPDRMVRAIEGALIVDREQRISKVSALLSIWSTDDSGVRVPVLENSGLDLDQTGPRTLAHAMTLGGAPSSGGLAYERTRDSSETPPPRPLPPTLAPPPTPLPTPKDTVKDPLPASSQRLPWVLLGLVLAVLVGTWWMQNPSEEATDAAKGPAETTVAGDETETSVSKFVAYRLDEGTNPRLIRRFAMARQAILDGEYADAERALNGVLESTPQVRQAHGLLALTHFFRGRLILSAEESRRAASLSRDRDDVTSKLIRLADRSWRERGNAKILLGQWAKLRAAHPDDPMVEVVYLVSARFLLSATEGLKAVRRTTKAFPELVVFTSIELYTLTQIGRHEERLRVAEETHARFPAVPRLLLETALAQIALGRTAPAEINLKKALAQDGSLTAARTALAGLYITAGREADRMRQMMFALSDTTAPIDRVNFLEIHGRALASHGRLAEGKKVLRFCVESAEQAAFPSKALGCSNVALDGIIWLEPIGRWKTWLDQVDETLAQPELDPDLRVFYSLRASWIKAARAARTGDMETAEAIHKRVRTMKSWSAVLNAPLFFESEIRWELLWARQDRPGLVTVMDEWRARAAKKGTQLSCGRRLRAADLALTLRRREEIEGHLQAVITGDCAPGEQLPYVRATARVRLAKVLADKGETGAARAQLDAFGAEWPEPESDLTLIKDAAALRTRLGTP